MNDEIEEAFADLSPTYPGSTQTRRVLTDQVVISASEDEPWDSRPRVEVINGVKTELFLIGALAKALNRSPITLRKWMKTGVMPKARFISEGAGTQGRGDRRLWSRAQVEGLIRIAAEEKIDDRPIGQTKFKDRSFELFRALREAEK